MARNLQDTVPVLDADAAVVQNQLLEARAEVARLSEVLTDTGNASR